MSILSKLRGVYLSFSKDVKMEIIQRDIPQNDCCKISAAYAAACFGKYFDKKGVVIHTESKEIAAYAKKLFSRININGNYFLKGKNESGIYEFNIKNNADIINLFKIFGHSANEPAIRINGDLFLCNNCVNMFISSAFIFSGTITNPEKEYNLEFLSNRLMLMQDLSALLHARIFSPRLTTRKSINVLYIKQSEQIEDLLTFMGASFCALSVMNTKVYKDFRNKANRITNCETANIDKIVKANQTTLKDIEFLQKNNAFNTLPQNLKDVALLRLNMPEASLKDLADICTPPISKSGIAHRFKKIEEIAKQTKQTMQKNESEENI